jgi:hypothetical protein
MKRIPHTFTLVALAIAGLTNIQAQDPLPSWNDTAPKKTIVAFVEKVTKEGSSDFVPPAERIATFDNDGTLWCEQPVVELVFTKDRLKELVAKDPTLKEKQPFKAALEGDREYFEKTGMKAVLELVAATHGNMSEADFETNRWMPLRNGWTVVSMKDDWKTIFPFAPK